MLHKQKTGKRDTASNPEAVTCFSSLISHLTDSQVFKDAASTVEVI